MICDVVLTAVRTADDKLLHSGTSCTSAGMHDCRSCSAPPHRLRGAATEVCVPQQNRYLLPTTSLRTTTKALAYQCVLVAEARANDSPLVFTQSE